MRTKPLLMRLPPPPFRLTCRDLGPEVEEWMSAHGMQRTRVGDALAWSALLSLPLAAVTVLVGFCLFPRMLPFFLISAFMVFVVLRQYALGLPRAMMLEEGRRFAAEAPEVIGSLSICISLNPSLEDAIRTGGDGGLYRRLARLQWEVIMGRSPDLETAISRMSSSLTEECRSLHQALYLLIGATKERTLSGRKRLLDKANSLVVEGMRERVGRFAASLQLPTMAIFCLGIILPILIFTIIPMTSMDLKGGQTNASLQLLECALLLILVPLSVLIIARTLTKRNPLGKCGCGVMRRPSPRALALFLVSLVLGSLLSIIPGARPLFPLLLCLPPSVAVIFLLKKQISADKAEKGGETDLTLLLYEIGNLLESGSGPEHALATALASRPHTPALDRVRHCLRLQVSGLGNLTYELQADTLLQRSAPMASQALVAVLTACEKDPQAAGALALDLAQYQAELHRANEGMRVQLRALMDMMTFTAVVFAPLVIGLTTSIFAVITATGQVGGGLPQADIVGGIYVLELCLIATYMNIFIGGDGSWATWSWRSAISTPAAALVLISASILSSSLTVR